MPDESPKPAPRGWAKLPIEVQREYARKGGIAAHQKGTAHEFTTEEARAAGRLGGLEAHRRRRARRDTLPDLATLAAAKGHGE